MLIEISRVGVFAHKNSEYMQFTFTYQGQPFSFADQYFTYGLAK